MYTACFLAMCFLTACHYAIGEATVSLTVYNGGNWFILGYQTQQSSPGGQLSVTNVEELSGCTDCNTYSARERLCQSVWLFSVSGAAQHSTLLAFVSCWLKKVWGGTMMWWAEVFTTSLPLECEIKVKVCQNISWRRGWTQGEWSLPRGTFLALKRGTV